MRRLKLDLHTDRYDAEWPGARLKSTLNQSLSVTEPRHEAMSVSPVSATANGGDVAMLEPNSFSWSRSSRTMSHLNSPVERSHLKSLDLSATQ